MGASGTGKANDCTNNVIQASGKEGYHFESKNFGAEKDVDIGAVYEIINGKMNI